MRWTKSCLVIGLCAVLNNQVAQGEEKKFTKECPSGQSIKIYNVFKGEGGHSRFSIQCHDKKGNAVTTSTDEIAPGIINDPKKDIYITDNKATILYQ